MKKILFKSIGIWFVIAIAAILNGVIRETFLVSALGENMALPISGLLLAGLIFLLTFIFISFIGSSKSRVYIFIGSLWLSLTLSFEFLFGHFVIGKSWQAIMQVFDIKNGNLFIVDLFITGISPWAAAKLRRIL